MPAIKELRLTDAIVQVGPDLKNVDGFGDDKFTFGPVGDVGALISGIDGDVTHVLRKQNGWLLEFTFQTAGQGIDTLLALYDLQAAFQINVKYGDFSFVGFANVINVGQVAAGLGGTSRTITLGCSYVSGNTSAAPGRTLQIT